MCPPSEENATRLILAKYSIRFDVVFNPSFLVHSLIELSSDPDIYIKLLLLIATSFTALVCVL